jgi:HAD superfamily hydrolase (TIGR01509 family)
MNNPEIRAAIFDIGNVLLRFNYMVAAERLRLVNGLQELPDRGVIVNAKAALEGGKIKRSEFLEIALREFQHTGDEETFLEVWRDIFYPNLPMVEFAKDLSAHMPVYLLSNISCIHREYIFTQYEFFSMFAGGAFSYELGCMKPEALIYSRTLEKFGLQPAEVILFDDMPENVEGARAAGWHAVQYDYRNHDAFLRQVGKNQPIPAAEGLNITN